MALLADGVVLPTFRLADEADVVASLMAKYADQPMCLADACLARMAEQYDDPVVFTLDRNDFSVYRRHGDQEIPVLMPEP